MKSLWAWMRTSMGCSPSLSRHYIVNLRFGGQVNVFRSIYRVSHDHCPCVTEAALGTLNDTE